MDCPVDVQLRNTAPFALNSHGAAEVIAEMKAQQKECALALYALTEQWRNRGRRYDLSRHPTTYDQYLVLQAAEEMFVMTHDCIEHVDILGTKWDVLAERIERAEKFHALSPKARRDALLAEEERLEVHAASVAKRNAIERSQRLIRSFEATRGAADGEGAASSSSDEEDDSSDCSAIFPADQRGQPRALPWMSAATLQRAKDDLMCLEAQIEVALSRCRIRCEAVCAYLRSMHPRARADLEVEQEKELEEYRAELGEAKRSSAKTLYMLMQAYAANAFETGWGQELADVAM